MKWLRLPLLLFLASCCLAQDGVSPDTVLTFANGFGTYKTVNVLYYHATSNCAWRGTKSVQPCGTLYVSGFLPSIGNRIFFSANDESGGEPGSLWDVSRAFAAFPTAGLLSTMRVIDSLKVVLWADTVVITDGDSLWTRQFNPRCESTCEADPNFPWCTDDSECNFYQCSTATPIFPKDDAIDTFTVVDDTSGWITIPVENSFWSRDDTTIIGFTTRRDYGSDPTGKNYLMSEPYSSVGDSVAMLVYYYSLRYNDISHQENADGTSPDTIRFICSVALDGISTPIYWSRGAYDWNLDPSIDDDAFRGERMSAFCCDTSRCGQVNQAMQPHIEASFYGNDIYWMRRASFLMELEKPIPDTTELDSMRFYCKFAYVHVDEGDSLFIVTYTPRDTSGEECYINYHGDWDLVHGRCTYPIIYGGTAAPTKWCNHYQCGDYKIWGDIPDRSYGRVPQYLAWTWFPIHPSIIDFATASVEDTFGIGLILKDENSATPTDTNDISIMTGADCPYIVYWFSEPEDTLAGFINWGLTPPHLGWGLPVNQVRKAWGGGRKP